MASLKVKPQLPQRKDYPKLSISSKLNHFSRALALPKAPLDILLLRGHALPIPYLTSPSISFLTHISPMGYLALMREMQSDARLCSGVGSAARYLVPDAIWMAFANVSDRRRKVSCYCFAGSGTV